MRINGKVCDNIFIKYTFQKGCLKLDNTSDSREYITAQSEMWLLNSVNFSSNRLCQLWYSKIIKVSVIKFYQ